MKINIYLACPGWKSARRRLLKLTRRVIRGEKLKHREFNLIIADDLYLAALNKNFLNRPRPTNVIAFDLAPLAEVYVSGDRAQNLDELCYLFIHGLLHLAGYDHRSPREQALMNRRCLSYCLND